MSIKQMLYSLCLLFFFFSIIVLVCAIKNKKKHRCKDIMVWSVVYCLFLALDLEVLPLCLNLNVGFELFLYRAFSLIAIVLFLVSFIISAKKIKKSVVSERTRKDKFIVISLVILPIVLFTLPYFKEKYYLKHSDLVLVCSSGENFDKEDYAYAVNEDYCEEISIGADFGGYKMARHLPDEYIELYYNYATDEVEMDGNKISIYSNGRLIYRGKLKKKISVGEIERIFYK